MLRRLATESDRGSEQMERALERGLSARVSLSVIAKNIRSPNLLGLVFVESRWSRSESRTRGERKDSK